MRPLGIDAQVRLDFHNGSNDNWYVTEFGNSLEWEPNGGLRPKTAIVGEVVRVCGRSLGAPEKELEFGSYDGLQSGLGGQLIHLPRLKGDRSEEHTSELQSLMRISYAVFCLKKN